MGFDNECLINIQSLAGEYFCPVCRTLVYPNEALQTQCTHLYCKPCLTYIVSTTRACPYDGYLVTEADSKPLVESNKVLAETIGKIVVHCLYHRSGCSWQGPLSECTSHCSACAFGNSPVVCNRCGIQIVHRQVQEHAQNCPGVNTQSQPSADGALDAASTGATAAANQGQTGTQPVAPTSQVQTSQTALAAPPQDQNQQASANPQVQAVAPAVVPTPEQWYHQQYQQFYQQYPGYDPYQQSYQQFYPYQQQAVQQAPQVYSQPHGQPPQLQPQVQTQPPTQSQAQAQPQTQSQPQPLPQIAPHQQPQLHSQLQPPVTQLPQNQSQVNTLQQLQPVVQTHAQIQPQAHPIPHGHVPPQSQTYPQPNSTRPHLQQNLQAPPYQQQSQMHHPQSHVQSQPYSQGQVQSQPIPQSQSQSHLQHHQHSHPQPHPSQPPVSNVQPQLQHLPVHPMAGRNSYPQPQTHQQMQLGPPQPHLMQHPPTGPSPPAQMISQIPQQTPQVRPPYHAPAQNQQPTLLPLQGQAPNIPPAQQQQIPPHAQHPGNQRPIMQPAQPPMIQQYGQQQPFSGPLVPTPTQLHHGHFTQQQPVQPHSHPQGPSHLMLQNSSAYPQSQQIATPIHGNQLPQSQHYVGRPVVPSPGVLPQPFSQSAGGFGVVAQVRPMQQPAVSQPSGFANYANRTNNQQTASDQQFGSTEKPAHLEMQVEHTSEKKLLGQDDGSSSQRTSINDANSDAKAPKSEFDMHDEHKPTHEVVDIPRQGEMHVKAADSEILAAKDGTDLSVIKQNVKEEGAESTLEPSPAIKSGDVAPEVEKDAIKDSSVGGSSSNKVESLEGQKGNLSKGTVEASFQPSAALTSSNADDITHIGGDRMQYGYQEGNMHHAQPIPQGPGVDEFGGLQGKDILHSSHPLLPVDQRGHQVLSMHNGPSANQQRPGGPSMLQPLPSHGGTPHIQAPGHHPTILRSQGPGHLPQPGLPPNPPEHFQASLPKQPHGSFPLDAGLSGPGSLVPLDRGPGHFGPSQRNFELQGALQGHYNQGQGPSSHAGDFRTSQGPLLGGPPTGPTNRQGGIMGRGPPLGPDGQLVPQQPINPSDPEMFQNQRPLSFDSKPFGNSHVPGSLERGPFGQPSGVESSAMRMNGAPGLESSSNLRSGDERFRDMVNEHSNRFPGGPFQQTDKSEFEDLRQFPRTSHFDGEHAPKLGSYFSTSRPMDRGPDRFGVDVASMPLDKAPHGFNYDGGLKLEPGAASAPSRFLPPYPSGSTMHPSDTGERTLPVGHHDDNRGSGDFHGPFPGFGPHHMEHLAPRSPGREYIGISSRGIGGLSGVSRGFDDIDGRERHPFSEGSRSFNLPSDPAGSAFHESRFSNFSGHLRRGEHDRPGNFRMGERINDFVDQDIMPRHLRRGEFFGSRSLSGHLRFGEPTGFGSFHGHARMGEFAGSGTFPYHPPFGEPLVGNKSNHPRLGEPGFRSSYSSRGFGYDGGYFAGDMGSFDKSRKRKTGSMGWCRICKVDCETVEGLDLHSQTREHQKMTMDMVISIKQQNSKKQKSSNEHSAVEVSANAKKNSSEGRGSNP